MSCPHVETTAVLAAFGEAPDDFWVHHATCPACQATVAAHQQTWGVVEPVLQKTMLKPDVAPKSRRWFGLVAGLVVAAGLLLGLQELPERPQTISEGALGGDTLDLELTMLEWELALIDLEP